MIRNYITLSIVIILFTFYLYKWYFIIPFITVWDYLIICDIERDMNEEDRIIRKKYNIYSVERFNNRWKAENQ